ncbi:MAG: hypothetical protein RLZZ210_615 [Pseudomonadota bacterium]|jgi:hypothetical protein
MHTFSKQEVIKLCLISLFIGGVIFGGLGYFLGRNSDQAEFYKLKLSQEKQEVINREKSKQALDKALAPLYSKESPVVDGNEQGY